MTTAREWSGPGAIAARLIAATVDAETTIDHAMARLDIAGTGVLLLADRDGRLVGVVTDGDIRRHLLTRESLALPCRTIATRRPLVATPETTAAEALELMDHGRDFTVNHLPVVNSEGRVVGLILRSDLVSTDPLDVSAVIMAGGLGTRLRPLTNDVPKPMLPVGDRPLLERTIERLRRAGVRQVSVTTHYLAEQITSHFGDGHEFGVEMHYVSEDRPLGTAGALRLLPPTPGPLLVINGDVLTTVSFTEMFAYHRAHHAEATVGVRRYEIPVPYGVLECEGPRVRALREKPRQQFLVNAGVYLLERSCLDVIPAGRRFDMTELIQRLLDTERPVVSFPILEYWLDIGQMIDYQRAQAEVQEVQT
jgi:dTDP-glucose pyrophosphorylase